MPGRSNQSGGAASTVRPSSGPDHLADAGLNVALVRLAAVALPPAVIASFAFAVSRRELPLVLMSAMAAGVAAAAVWQAVAKRPNALALNIMSAATIAVSALFLTGGVSVALESGIVVLAMAGVSQVSSRRLGSYVGFMAVMWAAPLIAQIAFRRPLPDAMSVVIVVQLVLLVFGVVAAIEMRRHLASSDSRYAYLFANAPIALWHNDFSRVKSWLEALRASGVEDLRRHLKADHTELREGIGRVVTVNANPAAAQLLGGTDPADLQGSFPREVIDESAERLFLEQFVAMWDGGGRLDQEYIGRRLDGTEFAGIFHSSALAQDDDFSHVVTAVSDITSLRAVERELDRTETTRRALLEALPDLLFVIAADGTYLDYHVPGGPVRSLHSVSESDLYAPPSEFLGKRLTDVLPADLAQEISIAIATALETEVIQTFEYDLPIEGQNRRWEMRISPIKGGDQVIGLVRDVTPATRARTELEQLVRSKDDFIAAVSHELRTPLTGIVGFSHILAGDGATMDPSERHAMLEVLASQSSDLAEIVEDLLVATKANLGRLDVAAVPIDLRAQISQVLEAWDPATTARVTVVGSTQRCIGDPARVRQVIRNLVSNGLRYGGDHVEVRIEAGPSTGIVVVADDGHGIPEAMASEIFQPYRQVSPTNGVPATLGIGLSISRTMARLMQGDITYERRDGETRFTLELPLAEPATAIAQAASGPIGLLGEA